MKRQILIIVAPAMALLWAAVTHALVVEGDSPSADTRLLPTALEPAAQPHSLKQAADRSVKSSKAGSQSSPAVGFSTSDPARQAAAGDVCGNYQIDDGTSDNCLGWGPPNFEGGVIVWVNRFTVQPGFETITAVSTAFGCGSNPGLNADLVGQPFSAGIWSDPQQDGHPAGGALVSWATSAVLPGIPDSNTFQTVDISDVTLPVGQIFFVIAWIQGDNFPAPVDESTSGPGLAWATGAPGGLFDPNGFDAPKWFDNSTFLPGVYLLRACASSGGADSDCCVPNGTPGCDCPVCQDIVCGADPFCCDVSWDGACAGAAGDLCGDLCAGGDFDCGGGEPVCGDGICDGPESCANCPKDCGGPCEAFQDFLSSCQDPEGTFVQFGNSEIPPIPADFFGPGSDPLAGTVGFEGTGEVDTIIDRLGDPFQQSDPPGGPQNVAVQIVGLNLVSSAPITVTFNGGQNPEEWAVDLGLSEIPAPPGGLNAFKIHPNGGNFESVLPVQPKFTFTKVDDPGEVRVLDTGIEGIPPVILQTGGAPWVHLDNPNLNLITDPSSNFVVGVDELNPGDPNSQVITPIIFQSPKGAVRHTVCPGQDVPECDGDVGCDDGNACTIDLCLEGSCENVLNEGCFDTEAPKHNDFALPCAVCEECPEPDDIAALIDPVYFFSGEFYESVIDLRIPGRGIDFVWGRKYRSKIGPNTLQGNGWDYSYNIRLEPLGPHLKVLNGTSRADTYLLQGDGTWTREEFFRIIEQDGDTSYTLTFPDTGTWHFHPLDGSPQQGKVSSITDRNGNTTGFDYDGLGRLVIIHDPLDTPAHNRDIMIGYNTDGFIASVTDFAGRSVGYEYYQNGDAGGSFGDLKSVTTPAVVNTPEFPIPAGHDYPAGKTTVYTYSKNFGDERLNHNILTITDPKGQTYLINEYAPTQNENDLEFDRIVRQTWGDPGDIIDLVYVPQAPEAGNNFATIKVILNDRVGNVKELSYDAGNRGVIAREYTGRADPDLPTTEVDNRPMDQLRPDDPPFFETRYEYNQDSLRTRIVHPNQNEEIFIYDVDNPDRRSQGNLLQHCWLPGPLMGDQVQICESFEYDDGFGGCCGTNFVTKHTDGRGNDTLYEYDLLGNRTHTTHRIPSIVEDWEYNAFGQQTSHTLPENGSGHRRRDEYTYYDSVPQLGYLHEEIVDASNLALTTAHQYNLVGQVNRTTDARGHDTLYILNQMDQPVREISREVADGGGVRYERDTFYDPNDNIVRVEVQNKDDAGELKPNTHFTEIREYEILNNMTRTCQEDGNYSGAIPGTQEVPLCGGLPEADFITTEYEYDANRNGTLSRYGEATNGNQPANTLRTLYDERDLVFREIRADGDADQSTTQYDHDNNRNPKRRTQGTEDVGGERITTRAYDGYDRLVTIADPMGNTTEVHYDANNNRVSELVEGELIDVPGGADNVRLSETAYVYDAVDRVIRSEVEFFDTDSGDPIDDGQSITETEWSDNSQVTRSVNDNNHETLTTYDTVNRRNVLTDQLSNTTTYTYDANSNVTSRTELEKSDLGNADQGFTTIHTYDGLDRLTSVTDNVGNTEMFEYDSRDNRTVMVDRHGKETRFVYDGLDRLTKSVSDMDDDGAGTAAEPGDGDPDIVTTQSWDDTSRLVEQTDDNDNTTTYVYDALSRRLMEVFADGTIHADTFDVHHKIAVHSDQNGSDVIFSYDLLDRYNGKTINRGPGIEGSTAEIFQYDGLSRFVRAEDDDSIVTRSYDSLSQLTRGTLNGQTTECSFDGVGNEISSIYPGGRHIECTYDELERKKTVTDVGAGVTVATYDYVGPRRVERREYGNGTRTDYTYDGITGVPNPPDDFGVNRIIGITHSKIAGGAIIDDRTFTWDKMYNKTQRNDLRVGGPELTHDYTYDNLYRLVHTTATDGGGGIVRDTDYDLDGVGNRLEVIGTPHPGLYTMDDTMPDPADRQMNQYTSTSFDARLYDANGNLVERTGLATMKYDYRNQMVEYVDVGLGQRHTYSYDALGRRIARVVDADGAADETRYFYDTIRVCEEQDGNAATTATYVYGLYIDEVLNMQRGGSDFYYHTDDLFSVMALTDGAGDVVERHEYGDYGQLLAVSAGLCDPDCPFDVNGDGQVGPFDLANLLACWGPVAAGPCQCLDIDNSGEVGPFDLASLLASWGPCGDPTTTGNPYLFTGRRFDPETGWHYYRSRYLDSDAGRFTVRDFLGMWYDEGNTGNAYSYVGNRPATYVDPLGTDGSATVVIVMGIAAIVAATGTGYYVSGCSLGDFKNVGYELDCHLRWARTSWFAECFWHGKRWYSVRGTKWCTAVWYCKRNPAGRASWYEKTGSQKCDKCK